MQANIKQLDINFREITITAHVQTIFTPAVVWATQKVYLNPWWHDQRHFTLQKMLWPWHQETFSGLPSGLSALLWPGLQLIILIVVLLCSLFVVFKVFVLCVSLCCTVMPSTEVMTVWCQDDWPLLLRFLLIIHFELIFLCGVRDLPLGVIPDSSACKSLSTTCYLENSYVYIKTLPHHWHIYTTKCKIDS